MSAILLPTEIIELIIHETWKLPLTHKDRLVFMKTSLHVSSQWLFTFLRESLTDVYFVSLQYSYYLTIPYRSPRPPPYRGTLTINSIQFSVYDYLASHCRSMTIGSTHGEVTRANIIVRILPRCPMITMLFQNYAQRFPCWLQINIQGLFANACGDGHLRLIFTYDTTDVNYSPRERYGYASEQHFYYPDIYRKPRSCSPFTGVRTLEMRGANPCAVYMTVGVCPDLEVLETDVDENLMQGGFDAANARPPASCPEEAYFFSKDNWCSPTEMLWPNRRSPPSVRKSVPQSARISGAECSSSTRQRKSTQSSENVSPHTGTRRDISSAGSDVVHAKKLSFAHRMRCYSQYWRTYEEIRQAF
ncbi:uncharacterized protein ARMOST_12871 [Armillaria ostoyae]|uniref:Uncharacterized protein n=1 Tax=Armillaria ostoyae TaxID=47428 RepID=A0A284RL56_ARMOS|nr:uncharacterized protein ARMOST_12871 [Armillaria ostoyae]